MKKSMGCVCYMLCKGSPMDIQAYLLEGYWALDSIFPSFITLKDFITLYSYMGFGYNLPLPLPWSVLCNLVDTLCNLFHSWAPYKHLQ